MPDRPRTRRATLSCEGCWTDYLAPWGGVADINGIPRRVCLVCTAILKRLGITVTSNDKEG